MHVLIIPGWQQTVDSWSTVVTEIEQLGHTAVVIEYTMPKRDDVEDIIEIANAHINQKCVVVGHSIGGRAAVQMGSQPLHHIVGFVLMSTPSLPFTGLWQRVYKFYRFFSGPIRLLIPDFIERKIGALWQRLTRRSPEKRHYSTITKSDQESLLLVQKLPVKLLWGSNDSVVKPEIGEAMAEKILHADFVSVIGGTDKLYQEEPELVAHVILDFAAANS